MRSAVLLLPLGLPLLLALSSCSSPPKPPTVDESARRPVNSAMAVELQACRSDLHNTRIVASESERAADAAAAALERAAARQQILSARQAASAAAASANNVFTVRFDFGSTRVAVPADAAASLVENARAAPLVLLRGRTDGAVETAAESQVARGRAEAVRDYLVAAGVDPARIRATYQPVGDGVADNASPSGRDLNRRVEIELYRAIPVALPIATSPAPAAPQ